MTLPARSLDPVPLAPIVDAPRAEAGFWHKLGGRGHPTPARASGTEIAASWVGAVLGIGGLGLVSPLVPNGLDRGLLIGSMGATAVLLYGAPRSPLAQPRAVIGGHLLSAVVGVAIRMALPGAPELAAALAVATAIAAMHLTRTLHPPGGATALIAVVGSAELHALGFGYALAPVGLGAAILLLVALGVNNLTPRRRYPEAWW